MYFITFWIILYFSYKSLCLTHSGQCEFRAGVSLNINSIIRLIQYSARRIHGNYDYPVTEISGTFSEYTCSSVRPTFPVYRKDWVAPEPAPTTDVRCKSPLNKVEREMFYLTTHSTHFIYGYMASDIWLRIILIVRKETRCRHIGYSYRLTARVLLYAPIPQTG